MAVTYDGFIAAFPEFANATTYPEASFTFWQGVAGLRLDICRWGDLLDYGAQLFIAHNLATQARNAKKSGGGGAQGPVTSKTIDKLSISRDATAVTITDAGDWNSTTYGIQFYQLSLLIGAGGIQL